jgi:hypothetical protein
MSTKLEIHLFIIWNNADSHRNKFIKEIDDKLTILGIHNVNWSEDKFEQNLVRFYRKRPSMTDKANRVGRSDFTLVVVRDDNPNYQNRSTSKGNELVNINIFDLKEKFREDIGGPHNDLVHATNNTKESNHDLTLLMGVNCQDYYSTYFDTSDIPRKEEITDDLIGAHGWNSVSELFYVLNNTTEYIVMRNWGSLPENLLHESHADVDMLVSNLNEVKQILNAVKVFPEEHRVHFNVYIDGETIPFDLRFVGDNYYDIDFQKDMLKSKVFNENGFYTPNQHYHFYSLLYHAYIHKHNIKDAYKLTLADLTESMSANYFNDESNVSKILRKFLNENDYKIVKPEPSVVFNEENVRDILND